MQCWFLCTDLCRHGKGSRQWTLELHVGVHVDLGQELLLSCCEDAGGYVPA